MLRRFCVAASALILIICTVRLEVHVAVAESQIIRVPQDYATIQAAVDAASPGDTIHVSLGTYYENVCINKSLCLVGESRSTTVVNGSNGGQGVPTIWIKTGAVSILNLTMTTNSWNGYGLRLGPTYAVPYAWLQNVTDCMIANNTIESGMRMYYCHNSTLANNSIAGYLELTNSCDNIIIRNHIADPRPSGVGVGVGSEWREEGLVSDRNKFVFNNITGCGMCGMHILSSSENVIVGNNIVNNGWSTDSMGGLHIWELDGTESNTIFHNNFANNTKRNAYTLDRWGQESWDDGYPSGGNYYDNYTGVDQYSGPLQNLPGSDGIGDTPYVIPYVVNLGEKDNVDRYPFMAPYSPCSISIEPLKTVAGQRLNLTALLNIANLNPYAEESIQVSIIVNGSAECSQTFTVNNSSSAVFSAAWNTTGFEKGTYHVLIKATAAWAGTTVDYEGDVFLTIPGDVDANRLVDIFDVVMLTAAYEARKGEPPYTPNKDIDGNGMIDIFDVVACTSHYEEPW